MLVKRETTVDLDEAERLARLEVLGILEDKETTINDPSVTMNVKQAKKRPNQQSSIDLDLAEKRARMEVLEFVLGAQKKIKKKPSSLKPRSKLPRPSITAAILRKPSVSETVRGSKTGEEERMGEELDMEIITEMQDMLNDQL